MDDTTKEYIDQKIKDLIHTLSERLYQLHVNIVNILMKEINLVELKIDEHIEKTD